MGKTTGFMDYKRKTSSDVPPLERIENFNEFHIWLSREEQQTQAARCMDCGVPFCQAGMMIGGMASGCPLNSAGRGRGGMEPALGVAGLHDGVFVLADGDAAAGHIAAGAGGLAQGGADPAGELREAVGGAQAVDVQKKK